MLTTNRTYRRVALFLVLLAPAAALAIGPNDTWNKPYADANWDLLVEYKNGANSWRTSWEAKHGAAINAITNAQNRYNMRTKMQPPLSQTAINNYTVAITDAVNRKTDSSAKNDDAWIHYNTATGWEWDGIEWYWDYYYYNAGTAWRATYTTSEYDNLENGQFCQASLSWAQGIDFANMSKAHADYAYSCLFP